MNWVEVLDPVCGLQQDDWSLHGGGDGGPPVFGDALQIEIIGWSGKSSNSTKYYVYHCRKCAADCELFGGGYFRDTKHHLLCGRTKCGCSPRVVWTEYQYLILCKRKAVSLGYTFLSFSGHWRGHRTRMKMFCEKHGEWSSGLIGNLLAGGQGCPLCRSDRQSEANKKPDDVMISSFFASGAFHPDTKFWRSDRKSSRGRASYWYMSCPKCEEQGEAEASNLQQGNHPCACCNMRQQECYINWIVDDHNNAVAIKFGIANNSKQRIKAQNKKSIYEIRQYQVYTFPDVASCKKAERECKEELICGVVSKTDMLDGWTETTCTSNLARVKSIYEKNGGVLKDE